MGDCPGALATKQSGTIRKISVYVISNNSVVILCPMCWQFLVVCCQRLLMDNHEGYFILNSVHQKLPTPIKQLCDDVFKVNVNSQCVLSDTCKLSFKTSDMCNDFHHNCWNSLRPSDAIWQHSSGSTLVQVMACCLMAPSHYLNHFLFIIREVLWHAPESTFTGSAQIFNP